MKTSNKILLGFISVLGLTMLSILVFAKSSLINIEQSKIKGNGKIIKMNYPIENVTMLEVDEFFEVYVRVGDPKLEIETDENIQALIRANYDNYHRSNEDEEYRRVLNIERMNDVNISPTQAIKLFLAVPTLEGLNIDNHSTVIFEEVMTSEKFKINAEEFSTLDLQLNTQDLDIFADNHSTINIAGTIGNTMIDADEFSTIDIQNITASTVSLDLNNHAKVTLSGTADEFSLSSDEFCEIDAAKLVAKKGDIKTRNHSTAYINVTETLDVQANEFTHIKYLGNPAINKKALDKTATLEAIK